MQFSATDAAFEGFGLARRQPRVVLVWAGLMILFTVALTVTLVGLAGSALNEMTALSRSGAEAADREQTAALALSLLPAYGLVMLIALGVYALLAPAVGRAVMTPSAKGPGYLQVGDVELRHLGLFVTMGALLLAVYIGTVVLVTVLSGIAAAALGAGAGVAVGFVGAGAVLVAILWVQARLALSSAAALREGGLGLKRSWTLTRGQGWPVLGGLVIAAILAMIVSLLILVIFACLAAAIGGMQVFSQMIQPDMTSLATYFTPFTIGNLVVGGLSSALTSAIMLGYGAHAYRQIVDGA